MDKLAPEEIAQALRCCSHGSCAEDVCPLFGKEQCFSKHGYFDVADMIDELQFELSEYQSIGTAEQFRNYKDWLSMSMMDVMNKFEVFVRAMRSEMEADKRFAEKRKRGRPKKSSAKDTIEF